MNIGTIIMNLRKEKGWSQSELAGKTGVSQVMVGKYERGDAIPSFDVAQKIAEVFGISLDTLSGKEASIIDSGILHKIQEIQNLDKSTQSMLFSLIDTVLRDFKARQTYAI